jgi:hypothetical protein
MSYNTPVATTAKVGGVRVGTGLAITAGGILSTDGTGPMPSGAYGYFYQTSTLTNPVINTANPMTFDTLAEAVGVSVVLSSRVTVAVSGTYRVAFTAQLNKLDGGADAVSIWLSKNGTNVVASTQEYTIDSQATVRFVTGNYLLTLVAGDYIEFMWSSADIDMRLFASPAQIAPVRPLTPSVRATISQV